MRNSIPLHDLKQEHHSLADELCRNLGRVIGSGKFVLGPELAAFESELARYLGLSHVLGVNSGTDALLLGLKALGIGPGDEVITTPFTFFATAGAIVQTGATPVFADIEPRTLCLSAETCKAAITGRTKAVLLVHIFGHCTDVNRFLELCSQHDLVLVEDAAQAIGSSWQSRRLGSFGQVSAFSFYPTKNLAALGDGGAIATSNPEIAREIRLLRSHGRDENGHYISWGHNSRLDEIQAAFLRTKLNRLDSDNALRRALAVRYDEALSSLVRIVRGADGCESNYHQYGILTPKRDELRRFLADNGVETGCYYRNPVHYEPILAGKRPKLPVAEQACCEILTLPIRPSLTDSEQKKVISLVRHFFSRND